MARTHDKLKGSWLDRIRAARDEDKHKVHREALADSNGKASAGTRTKWQRACKGWHRWKWNATLCDQW